MPFIRQLFGWTVAYCVVSWLWTPIKFFLIFCGIIFVGGCIFDMSVQTLRPKLPKSAVPVNQIYVRVGKFDDFIITNSGAHPIGRVYVQCTSPYGADAFSLADRVNPGETQSGFINTGMGFEKTCVVSEYSVYP